MALAAKQNTSPDIFHMPEHYAADRQANGNWRN